MRQLLFALVVLLAGGPVMAQSEQAAGPSPAELQALSALLGDPAIQRWLQQQAEAAPPAEEDAGASGGAQQLVAGQLERTRGFLRGLVAAVPTLPDQLSGAWQRLAGELQERGVLGVAVLFLVFAALGVGAQRLFWWATTGLRQRIIASDLATVRERLHSIGFRLVYGTGMMVAFALGSIGAFLLFDWPPLLGQVVVSYLTVFLVVVLVRVLGRVLLAPGAVRFRVVPMATATAQYWYRWSAILIGWFFFVQVTLNLLQLLGMSESATFLVGLSCGVVLVVLTLMVVWRHPERQSGERDNRAHRMGSWLLSVYVVVVWLLLFTGSVTPFYIGVTLLVLPIALRGAHLSVAHVLRPPGEEKADDSVSSMHAVCLERGLRAVFLIGSAYFVAWILGLDFAALSAPDTMAMRLLRSVINVVVIVLVADFAWHMLASWIDSRLATSDDEEGQADETQRQARMRTLLPILRNVILIVLVTMAALMVLSALGFEIGPLIAGAGVVGVAIGFGAQTLVKDVISGMFYLLDDAFRVGEYIQSGEYKGTVESFSLRSVKLRHHRGPLTTVPFGELGAVENMSRDWVIDKITVSVTYDTDLAKAKKIIKQVGAALLEDPEFAPNIIETMKMQGVEQFGDFAIQIRMKMMTKPGEQFVIRRRAYAMIKQQFDANGIKFAFPTVQVAGGEASPAAAQQALDMGKPAAATG